MLKKEKRHLYDFASVENLNYDIFCEKIEITMQKGEISVKVGVSIYMISGRKMAI